jgi:serine/threonine-protein kinase
LHLAGSVKPVGEIFARRYELLDPIAEGGMGSVWRVRDHQDGEVKAAKLLRQRDAGSLLRFMREQSTRIHHPHVVTPLSWVGEDDAVLFTMPLVRGGSVASLLGDWGALPEAWVATVVDQTLSALEAVHGAGVVHRDVKPANLLLDPTGVGLPHVRLTDFGIATSLDQPRLTLAATTVGTPGYAAPDQHDGADPDPRQDLYAVGTVGLEMLVGHPPPFTTDELPTTPLAGLFLSARNPDPDLRPASATAFRDALRPILPAAWDAAGVEVLDQFVGEGARLRPVPAEDVAASTVVMGRTATPGPEPDPSASGTPDTPETRSPSLLPVVALALLGIVLLVVALLLLLP